MIRSGSAKDGTDASTGRASGGAARHSQHARGSGPCDGRRGHRMLGAGAQPHRRPDGCWRLTRPEPAAIAPRQPPNDNPCSHGAYELVRSPGRSEGFAVRLRLPKSRIAVAAQKQLGRKRGHPRRGWFRCPRSKLLLAPAGGPKDSCYRQRAGQNRNRGRGALGGWGRRDRPGW